MREGGDYDLRKVKVLLIGGLAGGAAIMGYGIYRATHPPTLATPTLPAQSGYSFR